MLKALKSRVIGKLMGESAESGTIWTPRRKEGVRQLLRVTNVGDEVKEVAVGDVVILPDNWTGATLEVLDTETNERESFFVVDEMHLLAKIEGYDAGE